MNKNVLATIVLLATSAVLAGLCPADVAVRINGSGSALDMMKPLIQAYTKKNRNVRMEMGKPLGSSGSVKALLAGALDIAVSGSPVSAEDIARGARPMEYGITPLAIVTERNVPKSHITMRELEDIYAGRTTVWANGEKIRPVLRPEQDINTRLLRGLSEGMNKAIDEARSRPGAIVAITDFDAYTTIVRTPGAIGESGLTSIMVEKLPLNVLALNGVKPTPAALASRTYPLAKPIIFVVSPGTPPAALKFIRFVFSPQGRAIAGKAGVLVTAGPEPDR